MRPLVLALALLFTTSVANADEQIRQPPTLRDAADRLDHYRKDRLQNKIKCAAPGWMKGKVMP